MPDRRHTLSVLFREDSTLTPLWRLSATGRTGGGRNRIQMESYSDMSLRLAKGGARMPISIDVGNAHSWAASLWRFMAQSQAYCSFHRWSGECGQSFLAL
jgi:hypothetical protein